MRMVLLAALLAVAGIGCQGKTEAVEGSRGPVGQTGPQGPKGDKGDPGEPGSADGSKSGSRLQYLGKTLRGTDGSVLVQQGAFWDSELGVGCGPSVAVDGSLRCLPAYPSAAYSYASLFADASCERPAYAMPDADFCALGAPSVVIMSSTDSCDRAVWGHYRPVAEPVARAYRIDNGNCAEADLAGSHAFALGDELPPSAFVAFEE